MEKDEKDEPIEVDFYDMIEHVYNLKTYELAEVLGVSTSVLYFAKTRYTTEKRIDEFANILRIPAWYFDNVTTLDFPVIEKCKDEFYQEYGDTIELIKKTARDRYIKKIEEKVTAELPQRKKEAELLLEKYSHRSQLFHDMSDDYKMRDYTVEINLQEGDYCGSIYHTYSYSGYGLSLQVMDNILNYIDDLNCKKINSLNKHFLIFNDIELSSDRNEKYIHFNLKNANGDVLKKVVSAEDLQNYIVGFNIIQCEGRGKKKERRKCISCKNFSPIAGTAKGYCLVRKEDVQRSRIICAHDYDEIELRG